jgi:hypothetical protein
LFLLVVVVLVVGWRWPCERGAASRWQLQAAQVAQSAGPGPRSGPGPSRGGASLGTAGTEEEEEEGKEGDIGEVAEANEAGEAGEEGETGEASAGAGFGTRPCGYGFDGKPELLCVLEVGEGSGEPMAVLSSVVLWIIIWMDGMVYGVKCVMEVGFLREACGLCVVRDGPASRGFADYSCGTAG